jgi:hypothetical protein
MICWKILLEKELIIKLVCNHVCLSCMCLSKKGKKNKENALFVGISRIFYIQRGG